MVQRKRESGGHAGEPRLRAVEANPQNTPILDLAEGVRLYRDLLTQQRGLQASLDDLRGRILRAMERTGVDELAVDDVLAVRQVRHFPAQLDPEETERLLAREGRLAEAQRLELDVEAARHILDQLYVQGRLAKAELPFSEPKQVEALIVQSAAG
jgi:hypothetical protein